MKIPNAEVTNKLNLTIFLMMNVKIKFILKQGFIFYKAAFKCAFQVTLLEGKETQSVCMSNN